MSITDPRVDWALRDRVDVDGGRVAVDVMGDGPPVVLTHGTPSWSYLWRHVVDDLARDHTVYLWDLLGYGDSTTDVRPSIAAHATTHVQEHLEEYRSMPHDEFRALVADHLATATARPPSDEVLHAYLDRYAGAAGQRRWLDQVAGFTDDDTREVVERLGEIAVPTRVIWGEQDRWLDLATAEHLRDAIPGADLAVVPAAGHFLLEDDPAATVAAIRAALVEQSPGPALHTLPEPPQ